MEQGNSGNRFSTEVRARAVRMVLEYIGVDEVAREKGHDYMTVVYDMIGGHLIWVEARANA